MESSFDFGGYALGAVGVLWIVAVAGMFASAICESAKPKAADGEGKSGGIALVIAGIASLVTPILLFVHGFWSLVGLEGVVTTPDQFVDLVIARKIVVICLFALLAGLAIAGSIIGWIIRAAAPALGRTMNTAAVPLALVTLALTIFVASHSVSTIFGLAIAR